MKFKVSKRARFNSNLLAGCAFIALAVYGMGLPVTTVLIYLLICAVVLALIVMLTAGLGWLLSVWRSRKQEQDIDLD